MAVQLQWSLDKTVGTALSIARGVLVAANTDNVQPLAIASCEKFGNTIAMCQDTCRKIEMLTAKTPEPAAINFIRAYAGFDAADSATQLSKSQAGVQFLGLAAALVTSLGAFEGGNSLHEMIASSASDKTLLPTARQLKDLLQSLEPRLVRSGFLNTVVGWHVFLCQSPVMTEEHRKFLANARLYPESRGIDKLVDAFRQLSRIGEADVTKIRIQATICATWVIAFTKWCLGLPPSIYLDDGTAVLEQPGSEVDLIINGNSEINQGIQISVYRTIGVPSDLIKLRNGSEWTGLVGVEAFGRWRLHDHNIDTGTANRALLQALPYAIRQVIQCSRFRDKPIIQLETKSQLDNEFIAFGLIPFPEDRIIAQTMSQYLASFDVTTLHSLGEGLLISDLPVVKLHLTTSKETCLCNKCSNTRFPGYRKCKADMFLVHLATVCADILALSLFGGAELPLLHLGHPLGGGMLFFQAILSVILTGELSFIDVHHLLDYALTMVGHYFPSTSSPSSHATSRDWIMSSYRGQVIYPKLYETLCYEREGYLTLNWVPGLLNYNGEVYSQVLSGRHGELGSRFKVLSGIPVEAPRYLMPQARLIWQVEQCDKHLKVALGLKGDIDFREKARPEGIFGRLASALLLEACEHDPDAALQSPDDFCAFTSPTLPRYSSDTITIGGVGVVAVDGSNEMRFFSLSNDNGPFVLRKKACLSCCLNVCRKVNYSILVL